MAVIVPEDTEYSASVVAVSWPSIATGDTVQPYRLDRLSALASSVQMAGTWGGGVISMEGSDDGATWFVLVDVDAEPLTLSANGRRALSDGGLFLRPLPSGTLGGVSVTVVLRG